MTQRVAITGGTGIVGEFLTRHLSERGYSVASLARRRPPAGITHRRVEYIDGNVADATARTKLLSASTVLVHCAFSHVPGRYRGGEGDQPAAFWQDNMTSTVALLEHARQLGVERVILLSSRAVLTGLQPTEPSVIGDDTQLWPEGHYGALKAATEGLAAALSCPGFAVCALRPTGVYGVRRTAGLSKWFDLFNSALSGGEQPAERVATEVHGDDVAAAIERLVTAPESAISGKAFNCSDLVVSHREITSYCLALSHDPDTPLTRSVAADAAFPGLMMSSQRLTALGWKPGGLARLEATLKELVAAVLEVRDDR